MVTNNDTNSNICDQIEKDMCIVFRIVGVCLGIPNQTFKWYYRISANEPLLYQSFTPLEFYNTMVRPIFHLEDKVIIGFISPARVFLYCIIISDNLSLTTAYTLHYACVLKLAKIYFFSVTGLFDIWPESQQGIRPAVHVGFGWERSGGH